MRKTLRSSSAQCAVGLLLVLVAATAQAQSRWDICNGTREQLSVATGFPNPDGSAHTQGWRVLQSGACMTLNYKSIYREVYLRAMSSRNYYPPLSTGPVIHLCANSRAAFDFPDARAGRGACSRPVPFYALPFTGNHTSTRITPDMGGPLPQGHSID